MRLYQAAIHHPIHTFWKLHLARRFLLFVKLLALFLFFLTTRHIIVSWQRPNDRTKMFKVNSCESNCRKHLLASIYTNSRVLVVLQSHMSRLERLSSSKQTWADNERVAHTFTHVIDTIPVSKNNKRRTYSLGDTLYCYSYSLALLFNK